MALVGAAFFVVARRIIRPGLSSEDLNGWIDINWQSCRPLERLLDPTEFAYLRNRGLSKNRIKELRRQRLKLFRLYLRRLTLDFNAVHAALDVTLVNSAEDRPDLARELGKQRLSFYRGLLSVECHLALYAAGIHVAPSLDLIRPLEQLHLHFRQLTPVMEGAQA
jgi:hypothetical protein